RWPRDWSSDVCSSDLIVAGAAPSPSRAALTRITRQGALDPTFGSNGRYEIPGSDTFSDDYIPVPLPDGGIALLVTSLNPLGGGRSEEHTSELQSRGHL